MDDGKGIGTHAANWAPAREKLYLRKVRPSRMGLNTLVQCGRPQPKRKSLWSASPGMICLTILHQGVLSTNREAQLPAPHSPQARWALFCGARPELRSHASDPVSAASVPFASCTYGLASRTERQASVDRGATLELRFD